MSDALAAWAAVAAAVIAVAALVVSFKNRGDSRRAADAGERSASAAEQSAADAKRSADAAEATAKLERDARHDLYAPVPPAAIPTRLQASRAGASLFGEITVGRDYRMSAIGRYDKRSTYDIAHGRLVRANVPTKLTLETWPADRTEPETVEIEFRFWPALPGADVDGWSCPCDKETEHPVGHWRFVVPIAPPPRNRVEAEWQGHLVQHPSHRMDSVAVPAGWICRGDDNESCDAKSSSLS